MYQDFERPQYAQQHSSLVHIIHVLSKDCRLAKLRGVNLEPLHHFIMDMMIVLSRDDGRNFLEVNSSQAVP
jgi:hypothetical protein